jgi:hypothetical protein
VSDEKKRKPVGDLWYEPDNGYIWAHDQNREVFVPDEEDIVMMQRDLRAQLAAERALLEEALGPLDAYRISLRHDPVRHILDGLLSRIRGALARQTQEKP